MVTTENDPDPITWDDLDSETSSQDFIPDPICNGCNQPIEEGSVVSFGDNLWHVPCFRCAKCKKLVEVDSNLLLRSDGCPICENCSYKCHVCQLPITDEAIMTGDESYHAKCFRCKSCKSKIEDLVFAKTSQGIYCMSCHNQRLARSKRHQEAKASAKLANQSITSGKTQTRNGGGPLVPPKSPMNLTLPPGQSSFTLSNLESRSSSNHSTPLPSPNSILSPPRDIPPRPIDTVSLRQDLRQIFKPSSLPDVKSTPRVQPEFNRQKSTTQGFRQFEQERSSFDDKRSSLSIKSQRGKGHNSSMSIDIHALPRGEKSQHGDSPLTSRSGIEIDLSYDLSPGISEPYSAGGITYLSNAISDRPISPRSTNIRLPLGSPQYSHQGDVNNDKSHSGGNSPHVEHDILPISLEFDNDDILKMVGLETDKNYSNNSSSSNIALRPPHSYANDEIMSKIETESVSSDLGNTVAILQAELAKTRKKLAETEKTLGRVRSGSDRAYQNFNIAQTEYDREVTMRRENEKEIAKLQSQVIMQSEELELLRRQLIERDNELKQIRQTQMNLREAENRMRELLAREQVALAELHELHKITMSQGAQNKNNTNSNMMMNPTAFTGNLESASRHMSSSLDSVKENYEKEIGKLLGERDAIQQEVSHLRQIRKQCLEEAQQLNARNFELSEMNNELLRLVDSNQKGKPSGNNFGFGLGRSIRPPNTSDLTLVNSNVSRLEDEIVVQKVQRNSLGAAPAPRKLKWIKSKNKSGNSNSSSNHLSSKQVGNSHDNSGIQMHNFQPTGILRPVKCEHCGEKMWGLKEVSCAVCGITSHNKCSALIFTSCVADTINENLDENYVPLNPTFGIDLTILFDKEGRQIPLVVRKCIDAIEIRGMDYEGLYRKSGGASQMRQIVLAFERGQEFDLSGDTFNDISAITSVLKRFFRELPNPLLSFEQYEHFIRSIELPQGDQKVEEFRKLVWNLPIAHNETLRFLMEHLVRVQEHERQNLMTSRNLSVVFGPTLLRDRDPMREIMDMNAKNSIIEFMIDNAKRIFVFPSRDPSRDASRGRIIR